MKKRILSVFLVLALALALVIPAISVQAVSGGVKFTITPDKREVSPGDVVTYTVRMGPAERWLALTIYLELPEGLTIVENSLVKAPDLAALSTVFTPNEAEPLVLIETNDLENGFTTPEMDMIIFKCTVGADASGVLKVGMTDPGDDFCGDRDGEIVGLKSDVSALNSAITVVKAPVPATGISLNKTSLSLTAGAEETLTATVTPPDSTDPVTWTSSAPEIAKVDASGKVTAVAEGSAVITAAAGTRSASCTVTVSCAHNLTAVAEKPSTCKEQGWDAYKKCTLCGQLFDMSGSKIDAIPYKPLAEHTYGAFIAEVPAQCGVAGTKAHYHCTVCEKNFDEAHHELTDLTIPALEHAPGSAWLHDDNKHWHECRNGCGQKLDEADHTWTWVVDKAPTEDEAGLKHEQCSVCGLTRNNGTAIDKLDHVHTGITHHPAVPATCTATGYVEYWTCSSPKCSGIYYGDAACTTVLTTIITPIDAANHSGGTEIRNAKEATCTAPGHTGDTYCLSCGQKIADGETIAALGHDFTVPQHDETHHWNKCSRCDATDTKVPHTDADGDWESDDTHHWHECTCGAQIDKAEHSYGEWVTEKEPTETETGLAKRTCTCGHTETKEIPALTVCAFDVPLRIDVTQTGNTAPGREVFVFEVLTENAADEIKVLLDSVTAENLTFTDLKAAVEGLFKFQTAGEEHLNNISDGIEIRMKKGTSEGWTYAEERYLVLPDVSVNEATGMISVDGVVILPVSEESETDAEPVEKMTFTVSYEKNVEPENPKTGESSVAMVLVIAAVISAGAALVIFRKRTAV